MVFKLGLAKVLVVAIVIIAIAVAGFFLLSGIPTLSANSTVSLNLNSSYDFRLAGDNNVSAVFLAKSSNSSATVYVGVSPVLSNPIKVVSLSRGQIVNVSTGTSAYSNLQLTLLSSSPQSSRLVLSYIPKDLYIKLSPGITLLGGNASMQQTTVKATTTIAATTTVAQSKTTAPTTTAASNPLVQAVQVANTTSDGQLMVQWNALYVREASTCTQNAYNTAFAKTYNQVPSGPQTFANTSIYVPHGISAGAALVSPGVYNITYTALITAGNMKILMLELNVSGQYVTSSRFSGLFKSYSDALQLYQTANVSNAPCSAYV